MKKEDSKEKMDELKKGTIIASAKIETSAVDNPDPAPAYVLLLLLVFL